MRPLFALALAMAFAGFQLAPVAAGSATGAQREALVARRFAAVRNSPPQLRAFLQAMPKGADLHNHASGAVYAEHYLAWAAADGDCVARTAALAPAPCDPDGRAAADLIADEPARNKEIDQLSMRGFVPGPETGHDHFFATFGKFGAASGKHPAEVVAEATRNAALDHVEYLELMVTFGGAPLAAAVKDVALTTDFAALRAALGAHGFSDAVATARATLDALERDRRHALGCDGPAPEPACAVQVRYIQQVIRTTPPVNVFAQSLLGFELAHVDPLLVGLNFVAPEDDPTALRDYDLHMHMLAALSRMEPRTNITLHAGELTLGLVPMPDLRFHIREAVEVAGAQRIGHGVDLSYETDSPGLLAEMRRRHVLVEICLSSNDLILNVRGAQHPFMTYVRAGVPVTLATDDEGVSRIDLTHEYERAVLTYGLDYRFVKRLSRASLEYAFLPGASLWSDIDAGRRVAACATSDPADAVQDACARYLAANERARMQWALERATAAFETAILARG